jgi:hypothetical protein
MARALRAVLHGIICFRLVSRRWPLQEPVAGFLPVCGRGRPSGDPAVLADNSGPSRRPVEGVPASGCGPSRRADAGSTGRCAAPMGRTCLNPLAPNRAAKAASGTYWGTTWPRTPEKDAREQRWGSGAGRLWPAPGGRRDPGRRPGARSGYAGVPPGAARAAQAPAGAARSPETGWSSPCSPAAWR